MSAEWQACISGERAWYKLPSLGEGRLDSRVQRGWEARKRTKSPPDKIPYLLSLSWHTIPTLRSHIAAVYFVY